MILNTKNTRFSYRGWAGLNVVYKGITNIRLEEEYGSFTQQWYLYEEVTENDLLNLERVKSEMKSRKKLCRKKADH